LHDAITALAQTTPVKKIPSVIFICCTAQVRNNARKVFLFVFVLCRREVYKTLNQCELKNGFLMSLA
jgi:hypothetical protein